MHRRTVNIGRASLLVATTWALAACSAQADLDTSPSDVGSESAALTADELARIQAFLDNRYTKNDVRYSFHTKFGETIDCIGFFAQPGVRALAARGTPINAIPPRAPRPSLDGPLGDAVFAGQPDDEGTPRECPGDTVPILRVTAGDVRAHGGLEAFLHHHAEKAPLPFAAGGGAAQPTVMDQPGYAHVVQKYSGTARVITGTSTLGVFAPPSPASISAHSISQVWMYSGSGLNINGQTCTTNCAQTIEIGWTVDRAVNSNNPTAAHLFTFATNDGYRTGCYNNMGGNCVPFVSTPGSPLTPGITLSSGSAGGTQVDLGLTIGNSSGTNAGWTISYVTGGNGYQLGYYPQANFAGSMKTSADGFEVGGEIYDGTKTWLVPMGSGATPKAGYGQAAYHHDFQMVTTAGFSNQFALLASVPEAYNADTSPVAGGRWSNYFYYGPTPHSFWGQNYGFQWAPQGDWAKNLYKGECGLGTPITGISESVNVSSEAHGLQCGLTVFPTNANGCYSLPFLYQSNSRQYQDNGWDWDVGYYKNECGLSDFVQGVAQAASGKMTSILCCPGAVHHTSCDVQTFYTSNSPGYSGTDWDSGYLKGQCPAGQYVAGVSDVATTNQGTVGAAHALLCCSP